MHQSIVRHAALAMSAFALVVSTLSTPSSAAASNTPPDPGQITIPAPVVLSQPDLVVQPVGIAKTAYFPVYRFTVTNVGAGYAKSVVVAGEAPTKKIVDNALVSTNAITVTRDALNPGQSFTVDVPCKKTSQTYCDYGRISVSVNGVVKETNTGNNHGKIEDNVS